MVAVAHEAGIPAPRYELVAEIDGQVMVLQEQLRGAPSATLTAAQVQAMLALNARMAGLLAGRDELPFIGLHLRSSGPGFCLHESLATFGERTRTLLAWAHEVGRERDVADGDDLVHFDFHPGNVLVDREGRLTGLVDWDGAGRGDRAFDLVTLRFDLARRAPDLVGPVDDALASVSAERLRAYTAHLALRLVDWSIRYHPAAAVDFWLDTSEQLRARFGLA
jgi:Ser/Thr protein kinase RdoA (MazF antagonist)